ncbi:hypothetical protein PMAYCL1PPCAC_07173 [Pristionchus mayeri]|uniref:Uncharacterized protein n=1 Tax=Pristionchus mayeri TaxID=1317129 RepID=A0AAN5C4H5_9BILA|nr:hypothetical protein PMAYCL1PPCAC_07173 [Pristionchus mayeri]
MDSEGLRTSSSRLKTNKVSASSYSSQGRPSSVGSRLGPVISKLTRFGSSSSEMKITPGDQIDHESTQGRQEFFDQLCYLIRQKLKTSSKSKKAS